MVVLVIVSFVVMSAVCGVDRLHCRNVSFRTCGGGGLVCVGKGLLCITSYVVSEVVTIYSIGMGAVTSSAATSAVTGGGGRNLAVRGQKSTCVLWWLAGLLLCCLHPEKSI